MKKSDGRGRFFYDEAVHLPYLRAALKHKYVFRMHGDAYTVLFTHVSATKNMIHMGMREDYILYREVII